MFGNLTGWHFIIIAGVVVLLFGATKLPIFSKSLGQSIKIFRKEMTDIQDDRQKVAKDEAEKPVVYTAEPPAGTTARGTATHDTTGH